MNRNRKRMICSFLAVTLALTMTACGGQEDTEERENSTAQSGSAVSDGAPLQMVNTDRLTNNYTNGDGYYQTFGEHAEGDNLVYTDFATKTRVFLCNQPDCQHRSEDCPSFFPGQAGIRTLVPCGEQLYCFQEGSYTSDGRESFRARIWRMNLDGSDRKEVYTFANREQPLFTCSGGAASATDGVHFYFHMLRYEKETYDPETASGIVCDQNLMCYDMQKGELTTLCTIGQDGETTSRFLGCTGRELIYEMWETDPETGRRVQHFEALHVDTLDKRTLPGEWSETYWADCLYGTDCFGWIREDGKDVELFHFATEEVTLAELDMVVPKQHETWLVRDGHALLSWEVDGEDQFFTLNLTTGEMHPAIQEDGQGLKGGAFPCLICAEYGDQYLIEAKQDVVPSQYYHLDGKVEQVTLYVPRQALIPKEDYWNGIADNLVWIKDMVA